MFRFFPTNSFVIWHLNYVLSLRLLLAWWVFQPTIAGLVIVFVCWCWAPAPFLFVFWLFVFGLRGMMRKSGWGICISSSRRLLCCGVCVLQLPP